LSSFSKGGWPRSCARQPDRAPPRPHALPQGARTKAFSSLELLVIGHLMQIAVALLPLDALHRVLDESGAVALGQL